MVIIRYYVNVYWGDDDEDEGIECVRQERRGGTGEKEPLLVPMPCTLGRTRVVLQENL